MKTARKGNDIWHADFSLDGWRNRSTFSARDSYSCPDRSRDKSTPPRDST